MDNILAIEHGAETDLNLNDFYYGDDLGEPRKFYEADPFCPTCGGSGTKLGPKIDDGDDVGRELHFMTVYCDCMPRPPADPPPPPYDRLFDLVDGRWVAKNVD
jgi:hypothetical protein